MKWLGFIAVLFFVLSCAPSPEIIEEGNHIHALAFDPTEPGAMYVATHHYLEKWDLGTGKKERLGNDDYMGFVIASDGTFYSSGHSLAVSNVGIRKSSDKGRTWQTVAYEGIDFHDMVVDYYDPKQIYAWSTPPDSFLAAYNQWTDQWQNITPLGLPGEILSLAAEQVSSEDVERDQWALTTVYAGTLYGLFFSVDGGRTWKQDTTLENVPVIAIADTLAVDGVLTVATPDHILQKIEKNEGGKRERAWQDITANFNQKKEGITFLTTADRVAVYGVTKHSKIYRYLEGNWEEVNP